MITAINASSLANVNAAGFQPAAASQASEAFRSVLSHIHTDVSQMSVQGGNQISNDPVEAAKADLLPSPYNNSGIAANDGTVALRQSFDHALMVTLVSQVISGVGQSVNTLIKQQ